MQQRIADLIETSQVGTWNYVCVTELQNTARLYYTNCTCRCLNEGTMTPLAVHCKSAVDKLLSK